MSDAPENVYTAPWLEEALSRFTELEKHVRDEERFDEPEERPLLTAAKQHLSSPYQVWFELLDLFKAAWAANPPNMELIDRIYDYSEWCVIQPGGDTAANDLGTVVAVCFMEHIPQIPRAVADIPSRWSRQDMIRSRGVFSYHVGEEGFEKILAAYDAFAPSAKESRRLERKKRRGK